MLLPSPNPDKPEPNRLEKVGRPMKSSQILYGKGFANIAKNFLLEKIRILELRDYASSETVLGRGGPSVAVQTKTKTIGSIPQLNYSFNIDGKRRS
jgi:hypothetical protein